MKPSFQIQQKSIGPYPLLEVRHPDGRSFSILPTVGAAIHQLELTVHDRAHKLLVPMRTAIEVERNRWAKSAHLIPFPNRVHRGKYSFAGIEHQLPINFRPNGGHAIHGFLMSQTWRVSQQEMSPSSAQVELTCDVPAGHPGFPFPYQATLKLKLDDHGFQMTTCIRNTGKNAMPAGWGWHPYFRTGSQIDALELQLPSNKKLMVDEWMIPTGRYETFPGFEMPASIGDRFLDACLELKPSALQESVLLDKAQNLKLSVWQDSSTAAYLQVFTHPNRHGIALEPMSCAPDAFNNGLGTCTLQPGIELVTTCGVKLGSLENNGYS